MNSAGEDEEITKLRQIKWRTTLSRRIDEFSEVIRDDNVFEKYFGERYVEKLSNKSKELLGAIIKLGLVYTVLMLALFASQRIDKAEFQVFGYGFKNLGHYKEFLLFLASTISPISAVLSAYRNYINALINECLKKLAPNTDARKFYAYTFIDGYFDGLTNKNTGPSSFRHGFAVLMATTTGLTLLFLLLTLLAGSFFIQINVIYDVVTNPASPKYVNLFVVTFAIASILFSWLVSFLQFPMPEVDLSNSVKLQKIKKENPERYQEIMRKLARENAKKEELSRVILATVIYIATFTFVAVYWFPVSMDDLSVFLGMAMMGAFAVMFSSNEIVRYMSNGIWAWFFRKYPDESQGRSRIFARVKIMLISINVIVPFSASVAYAFYALT